MIKKENIKNYYSKKYYEQKTKQENINNAIKLRNRKIIDIKYKLWENLITRIKNSYIKYNINYDINYNDLIGCNEDELFKYINSILKEPFTLDNYPLWELDHHVGICNFNLNDIEEAKKCFNYTNIKILSSIENKKKKKKCERSELLY